MKKLTHRSTTLLGAIIVAMFLFVGLSIGIVEHVAAASSTVKTHPGRLVTIYDRGQKQIILTTATTVGGALKAAGITLDKNDAVEPAANQKLVAKEYQVNIYRARPVLVIDGQVREKVMTPYQTAAQIAADAGITLYPEDLTTLTQSDNIIADGAGLVLTITPATPLTMVLYGTPTPMRTQAKTVAGLLKEKAIKLGASDSLSVPLNTPITSGMTIQLWHNGEQTINVQEAIPFNTQIVEDADEPVGYLHVSTPGVNGNKTVTYEVDMENGQEISRTQIQSVVTLAPVTQVTVQGVKGAYTTPTENEAITWNYLIQQGFTRNQTAGIMGNLQQEHGFNTDGDGLAQWTGSRLATLLALPDPYSIYTQLGFMMSELNGHYSAAQAAVRADDVVADAEYAFQTKYEGCGDCMQAQRLTFAYDILESF